MKLLISDVDGKALNAISQGDIFWYCPPVRRSIAFKNYRERHVQRLLLNFPGMLFKSYYIFESRQGREPLVYSTENPFVFFVNKTGSLAESTHYASMMPNISGANMVCMGNNPSAEEWFRNYAKPDYQSYVKGILDRFWGSEFNKDRLNNLPITYDEDLHGREAALQQYYNDGSNFMVDWAAKCKNDPNYYPEFKALDYSAFNSFWSINKWTLHTDQEAIPGTFEELVKQL